MSRCLLAFIRSSQTRSFSVAPFFFGCRRPARFAACSTADPGSASILAYPILQDERVCVSPSHDDAGSHGEYCVWLKCALVGTPTRFFFRHAAGTRR